MAEAVAPLTYNPRVSLEMTADTPDLSIVLVNWNACEMTSAALESIRSHTRNISYEVFVTDNGSTLDASATELPRRFPAIQFIPNSSNMGFSVANNQGIARARGRYVLLLNNDTIQTENALAAAVGHMDGHPEAGALGILHRNADPQRSEQASAFDFPRPWREIGSLLGLPWSSDYGTPVRSDVEQDVDWVVGSFLLMRRTCLDEIGLLDERFFIYDEDIDWCRRARTAGWKIRFWPGASMVHVGASARPFMKDKTFVHFRSHLSYIRKHHSSAPAALYYLVMVGRLTLSTLWQTLRWLGGAASLADVRERSNRQMQFALLRPGRTGG
jgi:GT2 family glycosyltransferase